VVGGFAIALAGRLLGVAPLLAGITAGFALANLAPKRSQRLFQSIDDLLPATYALFFSVAGARIGVANLATLWPLALGILGALPARDAARTAAPLSALWITPMRALAADTLRALREPLADLQPGRAPGPAVAGNRSAPRGWADRPGDRASIGPAGPIP